MSFMASNESKLTALGPNVASPDGLHVIRGVHSVTTNDAPVLDELRLVQFSLDTAAREWLATGTFCHSYLSEERAALSNDEDTGYGVAWSRDGSALYVVALCPDILYKLDPSDGLRIVHLSHIDRNNGIVDAQTLALNHTADFLVLNIVKSNVILVYTADRLQLEAILKYPDDCAYEGTVQGVSLISLEWRAFEAREQRLGSSVRRRAPLGNAGYKIKHENQPCRRAAKLCDCAHGIALYRQLFVRLQNPIEIMWFDVNRKKCGAVYFDEDPSAGDMPFVSYRVRSNKFAWDGRWLILEARNYHLMLIDTWLLGRIASKESLCQRNFARATNIVKFDGRFASFCSVSTASAGSTLGTMESPRMVMTQVAFGVPRRQYRGLDDWIMRVEDHAIVPELCVADIDIPRCGHDILRSFDHFETSGMHGTRIKPGVLHSMPSTVSFLTGQGCIMKYWLSCLDARIALGGRQTPASEPSSISSRVNSGAILKDMKTMQTSWLSVLAAQAPDTLEDIGKNMSVLNRANTLLAYPILANYLVRSANELHALLKSLIFRQEGVSRTKGHGQHWTTARLTHDGDTQMDSQNMFCRPTEDIALDLFIALCSAGDNDLLAYAVHAYRESLWGASSHTFIHSENRSAADALQERLSQLLDIDGK